MARRRSATGMSHPRPGARASLGAKYGVARASQCFLRMAVVLTLAGSSSACLVSGPPEPEPVQQMPAFLDLANAFPAVTRVITLDRRDPSPLLTFTVPVRSEDPPGDDLFAYLITDYGQANADVADSVTIPASTYADESRSIGVTWTYQRPSAGCYPLTLFVIHSSSYRQVGTIPQVREGHEWDVALATWSVALSDANQVATCPAIGGAP